MDYTQRHKKLLKLLESNSLDALLIKKKENIAYLTGTRGESSLLFISGKKNVLITDRRYEEEYRRSIRNYRLIIIKDKDLFGICSEEVSPLAKDFRIGFEANNFTYLESMNLKKKLKGVTIKPVRDLVENIRSVKDDTEINFIRQACKDAWNIMKAGFRMLTPYVTESYIKNKLEIYLLTKRMKKADFDFIIASGKNTAMPHCVSSDKALEKGEMVIMDLGTVYYGYNSDLTRTIFLGKIDPKYKEIYNIVFDAQRMSIAGIRHGVKAEDIDAIARRYIYSKGLGKYFVHGLGHGIGLEVHEKPSISKNSSVLLENNMVVTIEPAVYIPGWGGVRIEDDVLVTNDGYEVLTGTVKGGQFSD